MKSLLQKEKLSCALQEGTSTRALTIPDGDERSRMADQMFISLKSIGHRYYYHQLDNSKSIRRGLLLIPIDNTLPLLFCNSQKKYPYNDSGNAWMSRQEIQIDFSIKNH
jgi:hypothetical protein